MLVEQLSLQNKSYIFVNFSSLIYIIYILRLYLNKTAFKECESMTVFLS